MLIDSVLCGEMKSGCWLERVMKKIKWKNPGKIILFAVIVGVIMTGVTEVLNYKDTGGGGGWQRFYAMPKKTADVMFFGSSHAHCTVDHGLLWDEYGIAGYTLSAGSQRLDGTYHFLKEAIRVQQPEVAVVEVWGSVLPGMEYTEEALYRNALGMHWSKNLFEYVDDMSEGMGKDNAYRNRVLCKLPIIHSRYRELGREDFVDDIPYLRGYRGSFDIEAFERPEAIPESDTMELDPLCEEYLYKIIHLAEESGTQLVFMAAPYILSKEEQMLLNRTAEIARQENIPMIDYNVLADELGLDYATDFRDSDHVNNSGAAKVTAHLGKFLKEEYRLQDRRGQKGYEDWEKNSRYLEDKYVSKRLQDAVEANAYLSALGTLEGQTVVLSLTGNYMAAGDAYYEGLVAMGICYEDYEKGGTWVFEDGDPSLYLPGREYNRCYLVNGSEIHLESRIYEEEGEQKQINKIIFNGKNYSFAENGINVLVYDQRINQIVDHAGVDIYVNFDVIREEE